MKLHNQQDTKDRKNNCLVFNKEKKKQKKENIFTEYCCVFKYNLKLPSKNYITIIYKTQ
jgi:hypothetical protein